MASKLSYPRLLLWGVSVFLSAGTVRASPAEGLQEALQQFQNGQWDAAEISYLEAAKSPSVEDRIRAYEGLDALYRKVRLFKKAARAQSRLSEEKKFHEKLSPSAPRYYRSYQVREGDSYWKISRKQKVSEEWLKRANGSKDLLAGAAIKLPKIPYVLIVDKSKKKLLWKRGEETLKEYPISIGRKGMETPEGEFRVAHKIKNPAWYWMKEVIPPGSPKNLLGTRWLGLNTKGLGIHGTRNPESIGEAQSHGCIRMFNHDVEELFAWVPLDTRVLIKN